MSANTARLAQRLTQGELIARVINARAEYHETGAELVELKAELEALEQRVNQAEWRHANARAALNAAEYTANRNS